MITGHDPIELESPFMTKRPKGGRSIFECDNECFVEDENEHWVVESQLL